MPIDQQDQQDAVITRVKQKLANRQIAISPPMTPAQLEAVEAAQQIVLPQGFRRFLLEVGSQCTMLGGYCLNEWIAKGIRGAILAKPFALETEWNWGDTEFSDGEWAAMQATVTAGTLELIDVGCGQTFVLIVTGPCRGEVWQFCEMGVQPSCQRQDFLGWFERWLDEGDDVDYFAEYGL